MASKKKKRAGKARGRRPSALERADDSAKVTLRTDAGTIAEIDAANLGRPAMVWASRVRNRIRWNSSERGLAPRAEECKSFLFDLGLTEENLEHLAERGLVEVSLRGKDVGTAWAPRVLPWEYILSAATREIRRRQRQVGQEMSSPAALRRDTRQFSPFTVVRHIERNQAAARRSGEIVVVIVTPGKVDDMFDLSEEEKLPAERLGSKPAFVLDNPTLEGLAAEMKKRQPSVVHFAGVDSHQAAELLDTRDGNDLRDGVLLPDDRGRAHFVSAKDLAHALTVGARKPDLVVFNLYHSAARIAARAVEAGVDTALGFQDTFDDLAAELFIGDFYRTWAAKKGDAAVAFQAGWAALRDVPKLSGSGIVLWSARSLVKDTEKARTDAIGQHASIEKDRGKEKTFTKASDAQKSLRIECEPLERLNYSLLHNRRPLFDIFEIRKAVSIEGHISDVRVEVELSAGEAEKYTETLPVGDAGVNMAEKVFIPLTSNLTRTLEENLDTSMRVRVAVGEHTVRETQHRVTLLPIREWVDSDEHRQFLPSFCWPLDPAVRRIITKAQPYLYALADDPTAGFDGYQSVDPKLDDPTESVDNQVAAIWRALLDERLGYINPPPSYTDLSQRLRTPSQIIEGSRGTCIDLALLMAACLEYVDIYPVVFLLEGHAFPGYWRSEEAWEGFVLDPEASAPSLKGDQPDQTPSSLGDCSWMFPKSPHKSVQRMAHRMVREQLEAGHLVALETVWLTTNAGLQEAMDDGWDNLAHPSEFNTMIDVKAARGADPPVTPLPLGAIRG